MSGVEVVGVRERQAEHAGQLCAVARRPEERDLWVRLGGRCGPQSVPDTVVAAWVAEHAHDRQEVTREALDALVRMAAERRGGRRIGAGCPPDAEVDAARMERLEQCELFRDAERRMVGQHDTARAHPDPLGRGGDVGGEHAGCRRGDGGHVVVFGHPEAPEAEPVGVPGEPGGVRQREARGGAGADDGQVEHGQRHHAATVSAADQNSLGGTASGAMPTAPSSITQPPAVRASRNCTNELGQQLGSAGA